MLIKKSISQNVITGFTCDRCGNVVQAHAPIPEAGIDPRSLSIQESLHLNFVGGYDSLFGDGNQVECDLCQNCLHNLIKEFCRIKIYEG